MLLSVSRLMFAWAEDGIFPRQVTKVHARHKTPHIAILASGAMASVGVLGSHFAGDFFLGIDIMVTSMLVNFLLMCLTVIAIPSTNPPLAKEIKVIRSRNLQLILAWSGTIVLSLFLIIHTQKDLTAKARAWYFHPTLAWVMIMLVASLIFIVESRKLKKSGTNMKELFSTLPPE
jgi:APA family basic amino acid/polyamine antiporter